LLEIKNSYVKSGEGWRTKKMVIQAGYFEVVYYDNGIIR
jgi:hypothetical protein